MGLFLFKNADTSSLEDISHGSQTAADSKFSLKNRTFLPIIDVNYSFSITKIMAIYPYPFLVIITQLIYWIILLNDCICILTGSTG